MNLIYKEKKVAYDRLNSLDNREMRQKLKKPEYKTRLKIAHDTFQDKLMRINTKYYSDCKRINTEIIDKHYRDAYIEMYTDRQTIDINIAWIEYYNDLERIWLS